MLFFYVNFSWTQNLFDLLLLELKINYRFKDKINILIFIKYKYIYAVLNLFAFYWEKK